MFSYEVVLTLNHSPFPLLPTFVVPVPLQLLLTLVLALGTGFATVQTVAIRYTISANNLQASSPKCGDCNNDGIIIISEVQKTINSFLGLYLQGKHKQIHSLSPRHPALGLFFAQKPNSNRKENHHNLDNPPHHHRRDSTRQTRTARSIFGLIVCGIGMDHVNL